MFVTETISEIIYDAMDFFMQNVKMTKVLYDDTDTLAAQDLVEALTHPTKKILQ